MSMHWPYVEEPTRPPLQANGHYAIDADGNQYRPAGNFDFGAHDRWVEAGHCPVVSWTKAWCSNRPHGKGMRHYSPGEPAGMHWDS